MQKLMCVVMFAAVSLALTGAARADELSDLKDRFRQRYGALLQLKNSGLAGETWDGWVEPVRGALDAEQRKLVGDENADRARLYALIAQQQNTTASVVAERNGVRVFKDAAPNHWLKLKTGRWVQKKDYKPEE